MKLYEIGVGQEGLEEASQHIAANCEPYLRAVNVDDVVLHRGMKTAGVYQYVKTRQAERRPRDTHPVAHEVADQWFKKKFGIPLRSASIFVVREGASAARFGEEHFIFPTNNNWRFFASGKITDFTAKLNQQFQSHSQYATELYDNKIGKSVWPEDGPLKLNNEERQYYEQFVVSFLERAKYNEISAQDLQRLPIRTEIMMVADAFYAVNEGVHNAHNLFDYLREDLKST